MNKHAVLSADSKPKTPPIEIKSIPDILKEMHIWLVWDWKSKSGKWTKVPVKNCRVGKRKTWLTYDEAISHYLLNRVDGIGIALADGLCGIDLDDCLVNSNPNQLAKTIIDTMGSYWEISPSGTGIKLIFFAEKPDGRCKNKAGTVEAYSGEGRYFTITGLGNGEVDHRQEEFDRVYAKYVNLPDDPCLDEMLKIRPKQFENDGSNRLFALVCRGVEHNRSNEEIIKLVRIYENQFPFPKDWPDSEIDVRIDQAEVREDVVRGSAKRKILLADDRVPIAIEESIGSLGDDVFQKERMLVQIRDGKVTPVHKDGMLELLTCVAQFERCNAKGEPRKCLPTKDFRAAIHCRGDYPGVPEIDRVVNHPILLPSGDVVAEHGYNKDTKLFLNSASTFPQLPSVGDAKAKLEDIFCDFPWQDESDLSGIVSIILTILSRHLVEGSTPLHAVDGNRSGLGKGYSTEVAIHIATGQTASRYSGGTDDKAELRKFLTASAIAGTPCILFDNVRGRFGGTVFEGAITTSSISDRLLGQSRTVDLPLNMVWVLTANNVVYTEDMPRRICPIFLDTELERPDTRTNFKYPNLKSHVREHRNAYCMAAISILSGYIKAGLPDQNLSNFGGFEQWSDLVRNAMVWAGFADPLANRDQLFEAAISASPIAKRLIDAWSFDEPISSKQLIEQVYANPSKHSGLYKILDSKPDGATDAEYLGKLLRSAKGLQYANRRIVNDGKSRPKWFIE